MVRLRKSYNKLKIALCCVLGFIVALGGVVGIWWLNSQLSAPAHTEVEVDDKTNYKLATPQGKTYSDLLEEGGVSGIDTLGYLAYTLDTKSFYHSQSSTISTALIATQTTNSFKDYKDGIMISSDFTYGFTSAGTQSCFVPEGNAQGKGAGVYMRTSTADVNSATTGTTANWNNDVIYYDRNSYLYKYGEYSTEMTVYILNKETVASWDEVKDNGDGTFTQTFYLDAPKAAYYYRYAMQTRGGLDRLPEFESITLTITFDDNFEVLQIDAVEKSQLTFIFSMSSTSQTTTSYTYGEETFDEPHYEFYENYYEEIVGTMDAGNTEDEQPDVLTLLAGAFAGVLNGEGQQFDATLSLGGKTYYGRIFLKLDMAGLSSDFLGAIEARVALSSDEVFDAQDIYLQLKDGKVEGYYSKNFAVTADVNSFGEIVDKFSAWADGLKANFGGNGSAQTKEAEGGSSLEDVLNDLIGSLKTEETDSGLAVSLSADDLMGIGLSARLTFDKSTSSDGAVTYIFKDATIGGLSYSGQNINAAVSLAPSSAEIISHDASEAPFDVNKAAENLYQLLSSETIRLNLSLEGDKLATLLSTLGVFDAGTALNDMRLEISGAVKIDGLTANAQVRLIGAQNRELLDANVYYIYNENAGQYGTAFLQVKNILGVNADVKVKSDIAQLATAVEKVIAMFSASDKAATAYAANTDIAAIINGVLGIDFGSVIKEVYANSTLIGATVNADQVLSLLGTDLALGDITLEYSLGEFSAEDYNAAGGWLYGSIPAVGVEATIYGSTSAIEDINKDEYLDLAELVNSALAILSDGKVGVDITLAGDALADLIAPLADLGTSIDGMQLAISGAVNTQLSASADVTLTDSSKTLLAASVYYEYGENSGTAYIAITRLLGKEVNLYVYGNIGETVDNVKTLISALSGETATLAETDTEESNEVADIISRILGIDFGAIIEQLKVNASGIETVINADALISEFVTTDIKVGNVTLTYKDGKLSGSALDGGLAVNVIKGAQVTKPAGDYLDVNKVINGVKELLASPSLALDITLTGDSLNAFLAENDLGDYASLLAGTTLEVNGNADIHTLKASAQISLYKADYTYLSAQVYYDHNAGTYGTAYITLETLLNKDFGSDVKVKCDIADTVAAVKELIGGVQTLAENAPAESSNTVAEIIGGVLGLDLGEIVSELTVNANVFTTTVNLDNLVTTILGFTSGESQTLPVMLGNATLNYAINENKLSGNALNGGLTFNVQSGKEITVPATDDFLDVATIISGISSILSDGRVGVNITLAGDALADLVAPLADLGTSIDGMQLAISGAVNTQLSASANVTLTQNNKTLLAASVYYEYGENSGTAYIAITKLLGKEVNLYVYGNIGETVDNVKTLISALSGEVATLAETDTEESNEVADIISRILGIDFGAIIEQLKVNASGIETVINADALISEFVTTDIKVGNVTLTYKDGKLSGSALDGGLAINVIKGAQVTKPAGDYLDVNKVINGVKELLASPSLALDISLTGDSLNTFLAENNLGDYASLLAGTTLEVNGNADIHSLKASAQISLYKADYTYLSAQVYYDYNAGTYGTAYITLETLLNKDFGSDVKVKCDIADTIAAVKELIGGAATLTESAPAESSNTVAEIIGGVLGLNLGEIVSELTVNANVFTTTVNLDNLVTTILGFTSGETQTLPVTLGNATLEYVIANNVLKGNALNGGLTFNVQSGKEITVPATDDYLDVATIINGISSILSDGKVGVDITLAGDALADLIAPLADLGTSIDGMQLAISGAVNTQLSASADVTLTDSSKTLLAASVYYEYGENSGTAYIAITRLLGKEVNLYVYGNIGETVDNVKTLISALSGETATLAETDTEESNEVADIISRILGIDFGAIIEQLKVNASGIETVINADALISEFVTTDIKVGNVTLTYKDGKLSGSALDGGLAINVIKGAQVTKPAGDYLDVNKVINGVKELLASPSLALDISLTGDSLNTFLAENNLGDYASLLAGTTLEVNGNADIHSLKASAQISLYKADYTYLSAQVYYDYNAGTYGTAYITLETLLNKDFGSDVKVKCDIADTIAAVKELIGGAATLTESAPAESSNTVAEIIGGVLGLNLGEIVSELTVNANVFTTTVNLDNLVTTILGFTSGETQTLPVTLGNATLNYAINENKLSGNALNGGLTFNVQSGKEITVPATDDFLDVATIISGISSILSDGRVGVNITLAGDALADLVAPLADLGTSIDGMQLAISGAVNTQLSASANVTLTQNNKTLLAASVYYEYGENSGTAYIAITKLLGKEVNLYVYGNIGETVDNVKTLISALSGEVATLAETDTEESNEVADIISRILGIDFGAIIEQLKVNASGIETVINADALISEFVTTDIKVGNVTLTYKDGKLSGSALDGGLAVNVIKGAQVTKPAGDYLDVNKVINGVKELLASPSLALDITLTGDSLNAFLAENDLGDYASLLAGTTLEVNGNADIHTLKASAQISLYKADYTYLSAQVYYDHNAGTYGTAYITLETLLNKDFGSDVKVKCDIADTVAAVKELIGGVQTLAENAPAESSNTVAEIIGGVLGLNLGEIVSELTVNANVFTTTVNLDNLITTILGFTSNESQTLPVKLGNATLEYVLANNVLKGNALNGGLTFNVQSGKEITVPATDDFLDVANVLELIDQAKQIVDSIVASKAVNFAIDAVVSFNETNFLVKGNGLVAWNENGAVSKVSLVLSICLYTGESARDDITLTEFRFEYNTDESKPFIRLAINSADAADKSYITVTRADISNVSEQLGIIVNAVNSLVNGSAGSGMQTLAQAVGNTSATAKTAAGSGSGINVDVINLIINALNGNGIAGDLFGALMNGDLLTVEELGNSVKIGLAEYELTVENGQFVIKDSADKSNDILSIHNLTISAGSEQTKDIFEGMTELKSGEKTFVRLVYEYLLDTFDSIDIGSFLGDKTYAVKFTLRGSNSGIPQLKGVNVDAVLYFTKGISSKNMRETENGKLVELDFTINISDSFAMKASAVYMGRNLYLALDRVNNTSLDLKVTISADDIYSTVENIIALIKNPDVMTFFGGLISDDGAQSAVALSETAEQSLTDVLALLLTFDYKQYVQITAAEDGSAVVVADVEGILSLFGTDERVGAAKLTADGKSGINLYLAEKGADGQPDYSKFWLELDARFDDTTHSFVASDDYINIGFVADLIEDAGKFLNSNKVDGSISSLFTLQNGTIKANIDISKVAGVGSGIIKINPITISDIKIEIGLLEGQLYASFSGTISDVSATALSFLPVTVVESREIGFTYYNNKITVSKFSGDSRQYWIMTPEYFIDNMFAKHEGTSDSPIRWMLDVDKSLLNYDVWNDIIISNLAGVVDLDSGISSPDVLNLYEKAPALRSIVRETGGGELNSVGTANSIIANYLTGFLAVLGGNEYLYGFTDTLGTNLNLKSYDEYYALSLNASQLTGGILKTLDAAIIRDETIGFGSLVAYGALENNIVTFSLNIDAADSENRATVDNLYEKALDKADTYGNNNKLHDDIDFNANTPLVDEATGTYYADSVFGGVIVQEGLPVSTQIRYKDGAITITVYEDVADIGNLEKATQYYVKFGSTIGLHSPSAIMLEDGRTYIYVMAGENNQPYMVNGEYPESVVVNSNAVFYKMPVDDESYKAIEVTVHNIKNGAFATFNVYSSTTLEEIAQRAFGGYEVLGGRWYTDGENGARVEYTSDTVSVPADYAGDATYRINLYAEFVQKDIIINGVQYTFFDKTDSEEAHYEITAYTSALAVFYSDNAVLVLENEIDGYPVTKIAEEAFAQTDTSNTKFLQTVIVPENITTVGGRAFLNNKNMKAVIFLADSVHLLASTDSDVKNNSQKFAFYGCTTSWEDNVASTQLHIYYKNLTSESPDSNNLNNGWNVVERRGSGEGNLTRATAHSDNWSYVDMNLNANVDGYALNDLETELAQYVTAALADEGLSYDEYIYNATGALFITSVKEVAGGELRDNVTSWLTALIDEFTKGIAGGAVGMYSVTANVSTMSGNSADVLYGAVRLSVNVVATGEKWYEYIGTMYAKTESEEAYTVDSAAGDVLGITVKSGADGKMYILGGEYEVTVSSNPLYTFEKVVADSVEYTTNTFSLSVKAPVTIEAYYAEEELDSATVYSPIGFTYDGKDYSSQNGQYNIVIAEDTATVAESAGYTFVGWAAETDGSMQYVTSLENGGTYYAIWTDRNAQMSGTNAISIAETSEGEKQFLGWAVLNNTNLEFAATIVSVNSVYYSIWGISSRQITSVQIENGAALPSGVSTQDNLTFAGWYADGEFINAVTSVPESHVLYARWQFTFSFIVDASNSKPEGLKGNISFSTVGNTITMSVNINEGADIRVSYENREISGGTWFWKWTMRYNDINIFVSYADGSTAEYSACIKKNEDSDGDRRMKRDSLNAVGNWTIGEKTVEFDGDQIARITSGSDSISDVSGNVSLSYSA